MADTFGLISAVADAKKGGIDVAKLGNAKKLADALDALKDLSEDLVAAYRGLERAVKRGGDLDTGEFDRLGKACKKKVKELTAELRDFERAVEGQRRFMKGDRDKIKLLDALDAKLDKAGTLVLAEARRRDSGEIILALLSSRGQASGKGAKRASSLDAAKPGKGLMDEIQHFNKEHKDEEELKRLLGAKRDCDLLDTTAALHDAAKADIQAYRLFVADPAKGDGVKAATAGKTLDRLHTELGQSARALERMDRAFRRVAGKLADKKEVGKSLLGSLGKVKDLFDGYAEELLPKGASAALAPSANVERAKKMVKA